MTKDKNPYSGIEKHMYSIWTRLFKRNQTAEEAFTVIADLKYFFDCIQRTNQTVLDSAFTYMRQAMFDATKEVTDRLLKEARASAEDRFATGDEEFDAYRKRVLNHDFYYFYSDDIRVYNAGEQRNKELSDIANEKGGIYLTFWNYRCKLVADNIQKGPERMNSEKCAI